MSVKTIVEIDGANGLGWRFYFEPVPTCGLVILIIRHNDPLDGTSWYQDFPSMDLAVAHARALLGLASQIQQLSR